jgi:CheY-like chemotaxis protein
MFYLPQVKMANRLTPVVALTAHAMVGDREKALTAACGDYATKPVEFEKLVELINRLISV